MKKNNWVKPLTYALIVFIGPLLAYFLIYVQLREEALLDRTYSHLTNITTRTEARFNSIFEVVRNACKRPANFKPVLEKNDIGLELKGFRGDPWDACNALRKEDAKQIRNIQSISQERLSISYGDIDVYADIKDLVGDIDLSDRFHDIFIFDNKRNVIFQKYPENGRIDKLDELVSATTDTTTKKAILSDPLKSLRINYRGRWYLMPSQPLQIDFNKEDQTSWQMIGLIEESQFSADKLQFQPDTVAFVVLIIAVIVLIGPFLKIWCLGRFESFRKIDVVLLIASGFTLCSLLTLVVIQLSWRTGLNEFMGKRLHAISGQMVQDINAELNKSISELRQAESFMLAAFNKIDQTAFQKNEDCTFLATASDSNIDIDNTWRGNLLKQPIAGYTPTQYPFFNMIYLMDQQGCQIIKWSTRSQPTNSLRLDDRAYFAEPLPNKQVPSSLYSIDGTEFFIEFITSRTTGEQSIALSLPITSEKLTNTETSPLEDCLAAKAGESKPCVAVMTTPAFRVVQPVLPHGFGFAIVDNRGNILTHHEGNANTELNLVNELADGSLLQRALYSRSEDTFYSDYHGGLHEFFVQPLNVDGIELFLVSFYSTNSVLMPLLEATGTTMMVWLIWFSLLFCLILTIWQWNKFLEGAIFAKTSAMVRRFETQLLAGTTFAIIASLVWPIVSLFAPIYIVSVLMLWLFKVSKNFRSRPFTVVAISWVLMLSATSLPAYGLFRLIQAEAFSGYFQLQIVDYHQSRRAQRDTMHAWLEKVETPVDNPSDNFARFRRGDYSQANRFAQIWKQYPLFSVTMIQKALKDEDLNKDYYIELAPENKAINLWQYILGKLPDYTETAIQLHAMYRNPQAVQIYNHRYPASNVAKAIQKQQITGKSNGLPELLGLVLLIILGVALWYVLVRTLGLRTENYLRLFNFTVPERNQGTRDLIFGLGEFTKKEYFNKVDTNRLIWVDLRVDTAEDIDEKLATIVTLRADAEPQKEDIVILDHFDDRLIDEDVVMSRIQLLETLARKKQVSVIVLLTIDPLSFVTATFDVDKYAPMIARLASVMAQFDASFYQEQAPKIFSDSKEDKTLREECYHPNLRSIYYSIHQQSSQKYLDSNEIIQLVKSRANAIYQHMWSLCSRAEKIMLVELAHENLVNPNNWDLARRLKQRGYLRRDPFHRIFNESFKQFILRMERVENIESWRNDSASTWHNIRAPLFVLVIGAIIFLAVTQPSFFNSVFAFAAAGTASLPFLVNLIMAKLKSSGDG